MAQWTLAGWLKYLGTLDPAQQAAANEQLFAWFKTLRRVELKEKKDNEAGPAG